MAVRGDALVAFNRGIVDVLGLSRIDIERLRLAAQTQKNWLSRVLGAMTIRPGTKYLTATDGNNKSRSIAFTFSATDQAQIELTSSIMRVLVNDAPVERASVSASVTNSTFDSDLSGWTDADETGAVSVWATGGYMSLLGTGANAAIQRQEVTVTNTGIEHALRITIERGPVLLRVGSSAGDDDYIAETTLGTGTHSLAFTPTGNFHIQFFSRKKSTVLVDSCIVESAGIMRIPAPWVEAALENIRTTTSGDVIYVATNNYLQYKIERRGTTSWSIVRYEPENGPFRVINTSDITLTPSGLSGDITLSASSPVFKSGHVGALFRVASKGQNVSSSISGENTFTDPIRVTGVGEGRRFGIILSGTFTATVTLQYSVNEPGTWVDISPTYSGAVDTTYLDNQDNQVIYYRIGVKSGDYTSGTVNAQLTYSSGSITGICRVTAFTNSQSVSAVTLQDFGATTASDDWWEGEWSVFRGHPTAVALFEGRLWWAGRDKIFGSISDAFEDWDDEFEGDAGPISRSIGEGPVDTIHWLMALGRLMLGTALTSANVEPEKIEGNSIRSARSSSFGEPLTPTNFNLKQEDLRGVYVDRSGQRVFALGYGGDSESAVDEYVGEELTLLVPNLNAVGISRIAIQINPDIRVHCVRTDGTAAMVVYDRIESVVSWLEVETDGEIEDVIVQPDAGEDKVTYQVKRTVNGSTVRYMERLAKESNCTGFPAAHLADAHYLYSGAETQSITGLDHLEGKTVVVWGWNTVTPFTNMDGTAIGRDLGTYTVVSGAINLTETVTDACVGETFVADYKSIKLSELNQKKRISEIGLSLVNTHYQGLKMGPSFDNLSDIPPVHQSKTTDEHHIWPELDTDMTGFGGNWDTDPRICLRAQAPRPCTVRSAAFTYER